MILPSVDAGDVHGPGLGFCGCLDEVLARHDSDSDLGDRSHVATYFRKATPPTVVFQHGTMHMYAWSK
jgi:hypothetical protein